MSSSDDAKKIAAKAAGRKHDIFNGFFIPPIFGMVIWGFVFPSLTAYAVLGWMTQAYLFIDIIYTIVAPNIHPTTFRVWTIIIHHLITMWAIFYCINNPADAHLLCWSMIVELNTLVQVIFKLTKIKLFNHLFMLTWFTLRLIMYPWLVWTYHHMAVKQGITGHGYWQIVAGHGGITVLNYVWTAELIIGLVFKKPKGEAKKAE